MNPKPRNFHSPTGWTNGPKVSEMYRTLQEGIVRNGMASYSYIPPVDRFALIHYVRTFVPSPPQETLQDLQPLETTYQLSRGTSVAGTVPIRVASARLLEESAAGRTRAAQMAEALRARSGDPLVAATVRDADRVSTAMLADDARSLKLPPEDFARQILSDPGSFGLRGVVARLSAADLAQLQRTFAAAAAPYRE